MDEPLSARGAWIVSLLVLAAFTVLVFSRLKHYALWDDEAQTALFGQAVWETGDTSARHGHNTVLYREAVEIDSELRNRLVAPLPYYVEAPFIRDTRSVWWARLPFALAGVATVALMLAWLRRLGASRQQWALASMAIVGSVALILYAKQARYYTLAMLCCVAATYAYAHRGRGRAMLVMLAVDYVWLGRKEARLSPRALGAIAISQVVLCAPVVLTWYPLGKHLAGEHATFVGQRFLLWLRTLRDLNHAEYGVGILMLIAPIMYLRARDTRLLRLPIAILVATLVVTLFTPQPPDARIADIRYVAFLIPACLALCVLVIDALPLRGPLVLGIGLVAFGTTFLNASLARVVPGGGYTVPVRSTLVSYMAELARPPVSAFQLVADWLEANARPEETVVVDPDYATYPLMFHVPDLVYGWQLGPARAAELPPLDPIQLRGRVLPDWIVLFEHWAEGGPGYRTVRTHGGLYTLAATLPATGVDLSRPELMQHRFRADEAFRSTAPITIWRRRAP